MARIDDASPVGADSKDDPAVVDGSILYLIHELSRLVGTNFDRYMAPHRLTHSQWWALMHIGQNPGASQTDLAELMQMTRGAVGKLLDRLETEKWIERRPDPADSRIRRVFIAFTEPGVFEPMSTEATRLYQSILGSLSGEAKFQLLKSLRQIHSNAQAGLS